MLPTRIFRNRWHALLFAGVICVLAAEFASEASLPPPAPDRAQGVVADRGPSAAAGQTAAIPTDDAGPGLFAGLLAPRDASDSPSRMLSFDTDGDGVPDATAREVR